MNLVVDHSKFLGPEWREEAFRALRATVRTDRKKDFIACMFETGMWPAAELTWKAAETRFSQCIAPRKGKHDQYFKTTDLWAWMKCSGEHALLDVMMADIKPNPLDARTVAVARMVDQLILDKLNSMAIERRFDLPPRFCRDGGF